MKEDSCPDCGAAVIRGRAGCQALFDEMTAQALNDRRYAAVHSLAFDAYCMQHPDRYCRSAKSYAAHLTRLCCGIEHGAAPTIYAAIQKWLNGAIDLEKPAILNERGQMTVVAVHAARSVAEHEKLVHDWAADVWAAYAAQHDLARAWLTAALNAKDRATR